MKAKLIIGGLVASIIIGGIVVWQLTKSSGEELVDAAGAIWTLGSDNIVYKNGSPTNGKGTKLWIEGGVACVTGMGGKTFAWTGTSWLQMN